MSSSRPSDAREIISLRSYIIRKIVPYVAALTGITGLTVLFISFGVNSNPQAAVGNGTRCD